MPENFPSRRLGLRRRRSWRAAGVLTAVAVGMLSGVLPLAPAGAAPAGAATVAPAALTPRVCKNFDTGDRLRQLSVCSSIWNRDTPGQIRGVVDMHTYKLVNGARAGDSVSISITLNRAVLNTTSPATPAVNYGANQGTGTCRLNSASGPVSNCSVPNTASVTFYGAAANVISQAECNIVNAISWRDDRNLAHFLQVGDASFPDHLPVIQTDGTNPPC
jgi:hypothetical protein